MFSIRVTVLSGLKIIRSGLPTMEAAIEEAESIIESGLRRPGTLRIYRKESWYATR